MEAGTPAERVVAETERRCERGAGQRRLEAADHDRVGLAGLGGEQRRGDAIGSRPHRARAELVLDGGFGGGALGRRIGDRMRLRGEAVAQRREVGFGTHTSRVRILAVGGQPTPHRTERVERVFDRGTT